MKIYPKDIELYSIAEEKLALIKEPWTNKQYIIDDLIINAYFTIRECIKIDSCGNVIDGFINTDCRQFLYNNKCFFELLGGNDIQRVHMKEN